MAPRWLGTGVREEFGAGGVRVGSPLVKKNNAFLVETFSNSRFSWVYPPSHLPQP
jgi:hypothetical protein